MLQANQLMRSKKMIEINTIKYDNVKISYNVSTIGNYIIVKYYDESFYQIYKGTDKNLLSKKHFKTLDDAFKYLHDRTIDHSVYTDLSKERYGTKPASTSKNYQTFQ
ncbi:MAG: hypothetical protein VW580_04905 [Flavobacteriaceae bacterium]